MVQYLNLAYNEQQNEEEKYGTQGSGKQHLRSAGEEILKEYEK